MRTKIFALALLLIMIFTLAACGGDNNSSSGTMGGGDTPPSSETQGNGGKGGDIIIPDNGTPPNPPAPFETHSGDKGYFYVTTDDYAVWRYLYSGHGWAYCVVSFGEDGTVVNYHWKFVFDNIERAENVVQESDGVYINTDNAIYVNPDYSSEGIIPDAWYTEGALAKSKDEFIYLASGDVEWESRYIQEYYLSKP